MLLESYDVLESFFLKPKKTGVSNVWSNEITNLFPNVKIRNFYRALWIYWTSHLSLLYESIELNWPDWFSVFFLVQISHCFFCTKTGFGFFLSVVFHNPSFVLTKEHSLFFLSFFYFTDFDIIVYYSLLLSFCSHMVYLLFCLWASKD